MEQQVGHGRRFRSFRQWSMAAGLNGSRAGQVADQGTALKETLRKLARPAGEQAIELYRLAGLKIEPEDEDASALAPDARELLRWWEQLPPDGKQATTEYVRTLAAILARST